ILDQGHIVVINGVPKIDKNRTQGKSGKRHGDSAVAYCMAVRASYMTGGEIDFIPLPAKHSDDNKDDDSIFRSEWDY
ncbi:Mu-like phage gp28, partial [Pasteurella multocida subsp. multocida str. Anand1_cattle]